LRTLAQKHGPFEIPVTNRNDKYLPGEKHGYPLILETDTNYPILQPTFTDSVFGKAKATG
jgi:hypothetical protein